LVRTPVLPLPQQNIVRLFHCHPTAIVQAYLRTLKLVVALVSRIAR
jgi:hypothetical protein